MTFDRYAVPWACGLTLIAAATGAHAQSFSEGFDSSTLPTGWLTANLSTSANTTTELWRDVGAITDGAVVPTTLVAPHAGAGFAVAGRESTSSQALAGATISNWLLSPLISNIRNGDVFSFYTTTTPSPIYADRLELRLSSAGSSTNVGTTPLSVGDFSVLLKSVNPTLVQNGYPDTWTLITVTVSGLLNPVSGRLGFRYFVTDGGVQGANSNIIAVDAFSYTASAVPEVSTGALFAAGLISMAAWRRRSLDA